MNYAKRCNSACEVEKDAQITIIVDWEAGESVYVTMYTSVLPKRLALMDICS